MNKSKPIFVQNEGVERGRRLVIQAFSPAHQRMRSPGDLSPTVAPVSTDSSNLGGFNPTRCNVTSGRPPKYSAPVIGRIENVGYILREIHSLPKMYQLWIGFQYRPVTPDGLSLILWKLFKAKYRADTKCYRANKSTLDLTDLMVREHLRMLASQDMPNSRVPPREYACIELSDIDRKTWSRTLKAHWNMIYRMIYDLDSQALEMVNKLV